MKERDSQDRGPRAGATQAFGSREREPAASSQSGAAVEGAAHEEGSSARAGGGTERGASGAEDRSEKERARQNDGSLPPELEDRPVVPGVGGSEEPRSEDTDLIGTIIDERYRITGFLGYGAMGSVYRAEHVTIRRPVALKLLHAGLVSLPEISARFEREAFAIGRIDHPNCVGVSDFGKLDDGSLYLALELVHGRPLADVLEREGRLEPRRALRITRHLLRGLAHAHRAGIVHRDVKPGNVVLTESDGDPDFAKILDFGIAKLEGQAESVEGGEKLTQAGIACGTPSYMSPEQVVGETAEARSDLYAAGVMLFELIAGRPPFDDEDHVSVLTMHTSTPPPRLSDAAPEVSVPLGTERLLGKALAKRREDRFATADAMIEAIDECLDEEGAGLGASAGADASTRDAADEPRPSGKRRETSRVRPEAATLLAARAGRAMTKVVSQPRRLARWGLPTVAIALVLAVGGWWFGFRDPGPSPVAMAAAAHLERGDPAGALALLEQEGSAAIDDDPHAQLQRGHVHAARREHAPAVEAYARALELRPELQSDPVLQTNLELLLEADQPDVVLGAAELLAGELADQSAARRLVELASSSERAELRHGALALAEDLGLDDAVDRTRSFSLDLRQADSCDGRREAVAKLRALGDPQAVASLRDALEREDVDNACLRADAKEAIRYLETLKRRTQPDAAPASE